MEVSTSNPPDEVGRDASQPLSEEEIRALLGAIRVNISRVHHEMSNPISIISGNAQLLRELAAMAGMGDDIRLPLEDIEAAVEALAEALDRLILLRNMIPRP
ncbi:hypothetical protein GQ464_001920 [Rhodocaloribacter litoris]|uniref:hypothetical protein n=1 Tax=Rhodocaloribacter litoris TaxID=2558931 RepID=UPI001E354256|nr:hypothetical protein [Rhodocaloribacter litoris]QXD15726.1 hypothetical protein GQ464_001920 [Rhodocaloribacter litoris]GIV60226.1 MAG: histidine kinase [Rhodothermaceae bacterium]